MKRTCVSSAQVEIKAEPGQILVKKVDSIQGQAGKKLKVKGKPVLLKKDIEDWIKQYMTNYDFSSYSAGMIKITTIEVIDGLSEKVSLAGEYLILNTSQIKLLGKAEAPAVEKASGSSDGGSASVKITVTFSSTGQ